MSATPSVPETLAERVRALAEESVSGTDLYLVEVEVRGHTGNRVVSVFLDADDGADLDALADASRSIGFALDADDVVDGKYRLEVSSPGTDRPLQLPRQYPRHVGRDLKVTYFKGADEVRVKGRLTGTSDDGLTLELPSGEAVDVPFDAIQEARVLLPW